MNIYPCVDSLFSVVVKECDDICPLGIIECFDFVYFDNAFVYWKRIIIGGTVSSERIIYF